MSEDGWPVNYCRNKVLLCPPAPAQGTVTEGWWSQLGCMQAPRSLRPPILAWGSRVRAVLPSLRGGGIPEVACLPDWGPLTLGTPCFSSSVALKEELYPLASVEELCAKKPSLRTLGA